jgi:hypothetical protein
MQEFADFFIRHLLQMMKNYDFLVFFGQHFDDSAKHITHFLLVYRHIGTRVKGMLVFKTRFFQFKLRKSKRFTPSQATSFITAPVYRDAAKPWIKGTIDIEFFQRKINLTQDELEYIIRVSRRTRMPAYKSQQLVLIFAYQRFKSAMIAFLTSAYKSPVLKI